MSYRPQFGLRPIGAAARTHLKTIAALALCGLGSVAANASLVLDTSSNGAYAGAQYETFDTLARGNAGIDLGAFTLRFAGSSEAVQGARAGRYAAPIVDRGNGAAFGASNGRDRSTYLSTGDAAITFQFASPKTYFGLLWGSIDSYNNLDFWSGSTLLGSISGAAVQRNAKGHQGQTGSLYVNVSSEESFDRIVARSRSYAFEFDNVAYDGPQPESRVRGVPVPPAATFMAIGLIAVGLLMRRSVRKSSRHDFS